MNLKETLHADDTMFFSTVKDLGNYLNQDFYTIRQWTDQWKLEFNPDLTKQATEVPISVKQSTPYHPQVTFNGTVNVQK